MNCAEMIECRNPRRGALRYGAGYPLGGMLGFEEIKDYVLTTEPGRSTPFAWLTGAG